MIVFNISKNILKSIIRKINQYPQNKNWKIQSIEKYYFDVRDFNSPLGKINGNTFQNKGKENLNFEFFSSLVEKKKNTIRSKIKTR